VTGQLRGAGDDGAPVVPCFICGADASGPCATCRRPVCGDCCELRQGVKTWAVCVGCAKRGSAVGSRWGGLLLWLVLPVAALIGLAALIWALRHS
jgi:hypothetical protein